MTGAERLAALRGLRVVPDEPGPEFKPGPRVPRSYRWKLAKLKRMWKEYHERHSH